MKTVTMIAVGLLTAGTADAAPLTGKADRDTAFGAIEMFYILNPEIGYDPVHCETKDDAENTWVFCLDAWDQRDSKAAGGLYIVGHDEAGRLTIWPMNGKAKQHAKRSGGGMVDENSIVVPVADWPGDGMVTMSGRALFRPDDSAEQPKTERKPKITIDDLLAD